LKKILRVLVSWCLGGRSLSYSDKRSSVHSQINPPPADGVKDDFLPVVAPHLVEHLFPVVEDKVSRARFLR
jgi:hypothetical protein